jgi:hypothetical protein
MPYSLTVECSLSVLWLSGTPVGLADTPAISTLACLGYNYSKGTRDTNLVSAIGLVSCYALH